MSAKHRISTTSVCIIFSIISIILNIIVIVFATVYFPIIRNNQREMLSQLQMVNPSLPDIVATSYFTNKLSIIFGIIATGIALFTLFGIVLSVLNVRALEKFAEVREKLEEATKRN